MTWLPPAPPTQPSYPPVAPLPPPHAPRSVPWYRRTWPLLIAVAVGGVLVGAAASGGAATKTKTVAGPTTTATATATATVLATQTLQPTVIRTVATQVRTVRVTYTPPPVGEFSDGTYVIPNEVKPGIYHTSGGDCYWERDSTLAVSGTDGIIANDNISGPTTLQILPSDKAFKTSGGCTWARIG